MAATMEERYFLMVFQCPGDATIAFHRMKLKHNIVARSLCSARIEVSAFGDRASQEAINIMNQLEGKEIL